MSAAASGVGQTKAVEKEMFCLYSYLSERVYDDVHPTLYSWAIPSSFRSYTSYPFLGIIDRIYGWMDKGDFAMAYRDWASLLEYNRNYEEKTGEKIVEKLDITVLMDLLRDHPRILAGTAKKAIEIFNRVHGQKKEDPQYVPALRFLVDCFSVHFPSTMKDIFTVGNEMYVLPELHPLTAEALQAEIAKLPEASKAKVQKPKLPTHPQVMVDVRERIEKW